MNKLLEKALLMVGMEMVELGYMPREVNRVLSQKLAQEGSNIPHGAQWRICARTTVAVFQNSGHYTVEVGSCLAHTLDGESVFCGESFNNYSPTRQEVLANAQKVLAAKNDFKREFESVHVDQCTYVLIAV